MIKFKKGDPVRYQPIHYRENEFEIGVIKEVVNHNEARVVYKCNNDWLNFTNYTSALTRTKDLFYGWE